MNTIETTISDKGKTEIARCIKGAMNGIKPSAIADVTTKNTHLVVAHKCLNTDKTERLETFTICFSNAASAKYGQDLLEKRVKEDHLRRFGAADLGRDVPDAKPAVAIGSGGTARDARTFEAC